MVVPENNNISYNKQVSAESIISRCLTHGVQFDNELKTGNDSDHNYTSFFVLHEKHIELPYSKIPFL
jgi:hypothetical protein